MRLPAPGNPLRSSFARHAATATLLIGTALGLSACLLDSSSSGKKAIPRPATLHPEEDAFLNTTERAYVWLEELERPGKADSVIAMGTFRIRHDRDTLLGGETRPFFDLSASFTATSPAPASLLSRVGFRASRVHLDSLRMPDPGTSHPFPEVPFAGWRFDTTVGDVRFVRHLKGVETISLNGRRHETWAFAESTWWQDDAPVLLGVGASWMGRTGLVRHQSRWSGYASSFGAGSLRRTLVAQ